MKVCSTCTHYVPNIPLGSNSMGTASGVCKRFPPSVYPVIQLHPMTNQPIQGLSCSFPPVSDQWHCGEHVEGETKISLQS